MRKTGSHERTMRAFEHSTPWGWRARIWHGRSAAQSGRIASSREDLMKRNWMLLAITLLCLSGCGRTSAYSDGKLFVSGRIDGDTVDLSAKRPGRVVEINVREGDSVEAGQVLAVLLNEQEKARNNPQKEVKPTSKKKIQQMKQQQR